MQQVVGKQVWLGPEVARRSDWIIALQDDVISALEGAVADAAARGETSKTIEFERYAIEPLQAIAADVRAQLSQGYGFCLLRGVPIDRLPLDHLKMLFLILGNHVGLVGPQSGGPRSVGEVMDTGSDKPKDYYYHRGGALPMHMDPIDVVGLLSVRAARSGGESGIVSSMAVHNTLLRERPDVLRLLYRGFRQMRRVNELTDEHIPIFADIGGGEKICTFLPESIRAAVRSGRLTLDDAENEAISVVEKTAERPDLILPMDLRPGDIQLLNNRLIMHNRFDYEDYPEKERRRLLLRLWLTIPGWRKPPEYFPRVDVETGGLMDMILGAKDAEGAEGGKEAAHAAG